jgi:PHP domain
MQVPRRRWPPIGRAGSACLVAVAALAPSAAWAADTTQTFDGDVPSGGPDHFFLPFDVPAGTQEIEILHDDLSDANILDFGLNDPAGYRGWGGGTGESTVVGVSAASRAYVPGPIAAGTWNVVVGKAKVIASPAKYHVVVTLRDAPTLPAQTDRAPYVVSPALSNTKRFYACDFHVHSKESTDAQPTLEEIAVFAESRGLDAVEISDHNTVTQLDYFSAVQARHPKLLLIPGIEYTTYAGHANAIGATRWVDHKIGQPGVTIEGAAQAIADQGALLSINHPALDIGDLCIGCGWKHRLAPDRISAVEIETGGFSQSGFLFTQPSIDIWESQLVSGKHIAAIGGSDDHKGGAGAPNATAIGNPTTMVLADELSVAAILDGIRNGRTVVKLQQNDDPMIQLTSEVAPVGDTVKARSTFLRAAITGKQEDTVVRFVKNGVPGEDKPVTSDPFVYELPVTPPETGEDHWRVEVRVLDKRRVVTSHLFIAKDPAGPDPVATRASETEGCSLGQRAGRSAPESSSAAFAATTLLAGLTATLVRALRRRRARPRA